MSNSFSESHIMPTTFKDDLEAAKTLTQHVLALDNAFTPSSQGKEFLTVSLANLLLFERKNRDYGPLNIARFGAFGCIVRCSDKIERLIHLHEHGRKRRAVNESIVDSYRDISNYGIIATLCDLGKWSK